MRCWSSARHIARSFIDADEHFATSRWVVGDRRGHIVGMRLAFVPLVVACAASMGLGCDSAGPESGCQFDDQCRQGRTCEAGKCTAGEQGESSSTTGGGEGGDSGSQPQKCSDSYTCVNDGEVCEWNGTEGICTPSAARICDSDRGLSCFENQQVTTKCIPGAPAEFGVCHEIIGGSYNQCPGGSSDCPPGAVCLCDGSSAHPCPGFASCYYPQLP